ncbi:hypothetical protein Daura_02060 [Dactylosporangium aurantiacum]|uniref:Uncharacterized protein n=1 Tax=Dactylosporangium aurantiacum TaxID=35754 RepID=A0A9Q9MJW4_9ACTN|nr:hypothetical protein [Dactylosporangium aurantiacum]MDG6100850.1 hypothetical protein [Dactylosporangium aurantiacum]UWZ55091.1 hypothetical protein Daura_02060 [Dactylosporangium aurantiacum]
MSTDEATLPAVTDPVAAGTTATPRRRFSAGGAVRWLWHAIRTNKVFTALLAAGALVRVGMMVAYYPAFGYFIDTRAYMLAAKNWDTDPIWPFGYPFFLFLLAPFERTSVVALTQHLLGLGMGVVVYALLRRRGIARHWSALAAAPILLDARELVVEHHVLSDTLFSVLLLAAVVLLLWSSDRLPVWIAALSGGFFAAASLTRTIGQVLIVVVLAYLVLRRVGWKQVLAFAVAVAIPLAGYMVWFHHEHGVYAINDYTGRYMWARTTTFVDCDKVDFTPQERALCPLEPLGQRLGPDSYLWYDDPTDLVRLYKDDKVYKSFATKAILAQPLDYVEVVLADTLHMFQPGWHGPQRTECVHDLWNMPSAGSGDACSTTLMVKPFLPGAAAAGGHPANWKNKTMRGYGTVFTIPGFLFVFVLLFVFAAALRRPRSQHGRENLDVVFLGTVSVALVMMSLALSAIDIRYIMPLMTLAPIALALSIHRFRKPAAA